MFKIGEFARISRVPVKTLRYYDEIGLLTPAEVDRFTGYRYYSADQLARLNRILTFKDLGLSLEQIARLLDEALTAEQIRGMLRLRQAEIAQEVNEAQARLARLETRIRQIEQEGLMSATQVTYKTVEPLTILSIREVVPSVEQMGPRISAAFGRLYGFIGQAQARVAGAPMVLYHANEQSGGYEFHEENIDTETAAVVDPHSLPVEVPAGITRRTLERTGVASAIHQGSYDTIEQTYAAVGKWMEGSGYHISGPPREIYLRGPESGVPAQEYLTEIQYPVERVK
ncbi:MAG: MerR family transcriptional regulator [Anaerolineae bacterium]|nr:MerR family transcriptional regulator [Anaerolineae bacterium]